MTQPQVCLNMIVKDEAHVIARCLESVMPYIDRAVICDTGSTDETISVIYEVFRTHDKPVAVYHKPWRDFATNRNQALEHAKAAISPDDYLLFIDADEVLTPIRNDLRAEALTEDGYMFRCQYGGWTYWRNALIRAGLPWKWVGVIHEYLTCEGPMKPWGRREWPEIHVSHDGARARDPNTYLKDIEVLKAAVQAEPENTRYQFYLAQSYKDAGLIWEAADAYNTRAHMGGYEEEVWFSLYQVARMHARGDSRHCETMYREAWAARPWRNEPLVHLAEWHRSKKEWDLAYLYASMASKIEKPEGDRLFIDNACYDYRALEEVSLAGFYARVPCAFDEGYVAAELLCMYTSKVPESQHARMKANLECYRARPSSV